MRFPIKITENFLLEPIMHTFGAKPEVCYAEIEGESLHVRMGIWFEGTFAVSNVLSIAPSDWPWWGGLGVKLHAHGVACVGSMDGIVNVKLKEPVKVTAVMKVECTQLWLSLEDRDGFMKALSEASKVTVSEHVPF